MGENLIYLKATGNIPLSEAEQFVKEFSEKTQGLDKFSVLIDMLDAAFLSIDAMKLLIDLLKEDNERLERSAFVVCCNPPLDTEVQYLIDKAESPKRIIVESLDEAKDWLGINEIIIKKD